MHYFDSCHFDILCSRDRKLLVRLVCALVSHTHHEITHQYSLSKHE